MLLEGGKGKHIPGCPGEDAASRARKRSLSLFPIGFGALCPAGLHQRKECDLEEPCTELTLFGTQRRQREELSTGSEQRMQRWDQAVLGGEEQCCGGTGISKYTSGQQSNTTTGCPERLCRLCPWGCSSHSPEESDLRGAA